MTKLLDIETIERRLLRNYQDAIVFRDSAINKNNQLMTRYHIGRIDAIVQSYAEMTGVTWQESESRFKTLDEESRK